MTLRQLALRPAIPPVAVFYLTDLAEARGKQELFTRQTPQRLQVLREHALIESTISSNRIEGVHVEPSRVGTLIFGKPLLRDRNEEEVRGYRDALELIHGEGARLPVSEATILRLHELARAGASDAGQYKERDSDIIEKYPDGSERVRFHTVSAVQTPAFTREMLDLGRQGSEVRWVPLPLLMAAMNLDFLCIHPFRDGNGRASRLLLLLQSYHLGFEVGRYISLERLIEENKARYYETLEQSSQGWHEGRHDPWPYIHYLLYILKSAYKELEARVGQVEAPRGAKTQFILKAIGRMDDPFQVADLQRTSMGAGLDMIRKVLQSLRREGKVECLVRGKKALWRKTSRWADAREARESTPASTEPGNR
jgi:Fic family protein